METCPDCGGELSCAGAMSDGDGDLYDEYVCDRCDEVKYRFYTANPQGRLGWERVYESPY